MKEWHRKNIDKWVANNMLSKESILGRLDQRIEHSFFFSPEKKSAFNTIFQSVCSKDGLLTEQAFILFLQTKLTLPRSPETIQAGKILYTSLAYLANFPFPTNPEKSVSQYGLSLEQLTRSLVWALPSSYSAVIIEGSDSRLRTRADHRRLVFQSLASATHTIPYDYEGARKLAFEDAFDVDWEPHLDFCSLNLDDDGDEIYHDILDVLYSTQEEKHPWLSTVPRDAFRPVAKRIAIENNVPLLYPSGIPTQQFVPLVKLLLALQLGSTGTEINLNHFNDAAKSICAAFRAHNGPEIITWPNFNHALKKIAPYLFEPLYDMLEIAFLEREVSRYLNDCDPPSTFGDILTLPLMSQLSTFLAGCTYFGDFKRLQHFTASNRPSPIAVIEAVEKAPNEAIIILSGTTKSGYTHTFGVFSPKPKADGASIQTNLIPDHAGLEPCSIFQLAPIQDVFRGVPGKPGWAVNSDTITFGQSDGVVMILKDGLRHAEIRHHVSDTTDNDGAYSTNDSRGSWTIEFAILEIEIWSEVD